MALLEIKKAGDAVLKEICRPVDKIDKRLKRTLDDMADTMYAADGVGLAAPQVGLPLRMVVIDVGEGLLEMINPVIIASDGLEADTEGCLSVPKIFGEVERASHVTVEFLDRRHKKKRLEAEKLMARAIQHELDHLDGILFIDKAKFLKKEG